MNFLFFGRLSREKGFDLVVDVFSGFLKKNGKFPGNLFIFGEGSQKDLLFQAFGLSSFFEDCSHFSSSEMEDFLKGFGESQGDIPKKIYFFGWQSQKTIFSFFPITHFCLVLSRFLETFGLVALESLAEGIPVIGFRKGGLVPFILPELSIPFSDDETNRQETSKKITGVCDEYADSGRWKSLSIRSSEIADGYSQNRWMEQVRTFLPPQTKKILLVTDYTTILGGIETHVHNVANLLKKHGYEVEIFGWDIKKGKWTKFLRYSGLIASYYNVVFARKLRRRIFEYNPDTIWLHSVSRFLGPLAVRGVVQSKIFSCITYHDLGIWSPFPSQVEKEEDVPNSPDFFSFLASTQRRNPLILLAACFKYPQIFSLRKNLRLVSLHIVPSEFLSKYVRNLSKVPKERVVVLEHFR